MSPPDTTDLTPYITPEIMPNLYAILEENPGIRAAITMDDGGIYGLPAGEQMGTAGIGAEEDYPSLRGESAAEIKKAVARAWEEITLQQEAEPIDVKLTPEDKKRGDLLAKVLPKAVPRVMKVAFVHDQTPETSGWTYAADP